MNTFFVLKQRKQNLGAVQIGKMAYHQHDQYDVGLLTVGMIQIRVWVAGSWLGGYEVAAVCVHHPFTITQVPAHILYLLYNSHQLNYFCVSPFEPNYLLTFCLTVSCLTSHSKCDRQCLLSVFSVLRECYFLFELLNLVLYFIGLTDSVLFTSNTVQQAQSFHFIFNFSTYLKFSQNNLKLLTFAHLPL